MTGRSHAQDRAAAVSRAVIQIFSVSVLRWLRGDPADFALVRAEIEATLRDHFTEIARETRDEIRPTDK